jgi:hypothetical protein
MVIPKSKEKLGKSDHLMSNLLSLVLIFFAAVLIYGFRRRIVAPLRRFEARNAQRRADELRALFDRYAHYRQTVQFAEEQVEPVTKITVPDGRTGEPVSRYLFLGSQYATRKEADAARYALVVEKAREFYLDLDKIYLSRRGRPQATVAAPGLTDASKHETYTPPRH